MSQLSTTPPEKDHGAAEVLDWFVDFSPYAWSPSEAVASCAATLTEKTTGQVYAAGLGDGTGGVPAPAFTGKIVTVWIKGLVLGHDYVLKTTVTTNQGRVHEAVTLFHCVA